MDISDSQITERTLHNLALVERLTGVSSMVYLRFAPPLFSLLSLIPLILLILETTSSRSAAFVAAIIVASSQPIFMLQGTSGGIVRGLAYLLVLNGIWLFLRAYRTYCSRFALYSGVLLGLTALTHLAYALFGALFAASFFIMHFFQKPLWKLLLVTGISALLIFAPWALLIIHRYGWNVFTGAFQSHENSYFLLMVQDTSRIIPWFENWLRPIFRLQFFWGVIVLGLIFAVLDRKSWLTLWFFSILFFSSESARYLITIGAILAGLIISKLIDAFQHPARATPIGHIGLERSFLFVLIFAGFFYGQGWREIPTRNIPSIDSNTMMLADYLKTQSTENASYLVIADAGEAEWFPYLSHKVPAVASWGSEWTGSYNKNLGFINDLAICEQQESMPCLAELIARLPVKPTLLITHQSAEILNQQIAAISGWKKVYSNDRYYVWEAVNTTGLPSQ